MVKKNLNIRCIEINLDYNFLCLEYKKNLNIRCIEIYDKPIVFFWDEGRTSTLDVLKWIMNLYIKQYVVEEPQH